MEVMISVGAESLIAWRLGLCLLASHRIGSLAARASDAGDRVRPFTLQLYTADDVQTGDGRPCLGMD